ncbi:MAG: hypothetical protein AABX14_03535 [Candidatus Aenigmatarchaeota archaeon]
MSDESRRRRAEWREVWAEECLANDPRTTEILHTVETSRFTDLDEEEVIDAYCKDAEGELFKIRFNRKTLEKLREIPMFEPRKMIIIEQTARAIVAYAFASLASYIPDIANAFGKNRTLLVFTTGTLVYGVGAFYFMKETMQDYRNDKVAWEIYQRSLKKE